MGTISNSSSLDIRIAMSAPQKEINLLRGWPAASLLPAHLMARGAERILSDPAVYTPAMQYGPSGGYPLLRSSLTQWLARHYRVKPDTERLAITGGASQSIANVLLSFTDPVITRAVWFVAPTYHLASNIFEDAGFKHRLRATPEDEDGVNLEILENKILALEEEEKHLPKSKACAPFKDGNPGRKIYKHIIYVVPTFSNPSGKTMSVPRREGLVRLARKYDALIISDDVYDFLQWPASGGSLSPLTDGPSDLHLPRLSDIDRALDGASPHGFGNAVSNGSFSKIIGPGVRTGWIEGTTAFITGLGMTGSTNSGGCPSHLTAAMIATIVDSGELEAYIDSTVRPALQRRHRATVDALHKYVLPHGIQLRETSLIGSDTYGGYFIWFTLDDGLSAKLVSKIARDEENLVVAPGAIFEVHGDESSATFDNHLRLCFSWVDEEDLVEGARRLGSVMARVRANRQSYESRGIPELEDDFVNSLK